MEISHTEKCNPVNKGSNTNRANGMSRNGNMTKKRDFFANLVERIKTDPQTLFEGDTIERIATLKSEHSSEYKAICEGLKKAGSRLDAGETEDKGNQRDILIGFADDIQLFHAPNGVAYADIQIGAHRETWAVRSGGFKHWLSRRFFEKTGKSLNPQTIREALAEFEARGTFGGTEQEVFLRVANLGDTVYINLCNELWQAVEVDVKGWRIVDTPPVRFIRKPGMKSLPYPEDSDDLSFLRSLLNVSEQQFVLSWSWNLCSIYNRKNFPPMIVNGCAGSSKSTFTRIIRSIIDPNESPIFIFPEKRDDLLGDANYSHILAYDNISRVSSKFSDTLCQISTEAHASGRRGAKQKEFLSSLTSPVILNGVEFSTREDLSDRAVFIELEPIDKEVRKSSSELWQDFEREHPRILGACLNGLVEGLRNIKKARSRLPYLPRMSDFALFSTACETAFWEEGTFWKAYSRNISQAADDIIEASPLGDALCDFIVRQPRKTWEGTAAGLVRVLMVREFSTPEKLGRSLRRLSTPLREKGIQIEFKRERGNRKRIIRITVDEDPNSPRDNSVSIRNDTDANHSSSIGVRPAQEGNPATLVSGHGLESEENTQTLSIDNKQDTPMEVKITYGPCNDIYDTDNLPTVIPYQSGRDNIHPRTIYQGDNLLILREMGPETVDLIATDPPFNSGREWEGSSGAIFSDKWNWQNVREEWLNDIQKIEGLADYISYVQKTNSSMAAFLCFMAVRLMEIKRILKDTGSIYLHCDPTASHHLREVMNLIFGKENFRNEIAWCYSTGGASTTRFAKKHDVILYYSKTDNIVFNTPRVPYTSTMSKSKKHAHKFHEDGKIMLDWWDDIPALNTIANERNGYPTQKPVQLYKRIIEASSNPGDVVLDPFCGSGTTLIAAEQLERRWIGVDSSKDACQTAQGRFGTASKTHRDNYARHWQMGNDRDFQGPHISGFKLIYE